MNESTRSAPMPAQSALDEREWRTPANWKFGMFYVSARDSRDWVSRRPVLGWRPYGVTPNFAKPRARRAVALGTVTLLAVLLAAALLRLPG
jgi:uncharacterized membrane protein